MSAAEESVNPFGAVAERAPSSNAVAKTDQQRAIAEVQAAMMIARMNPRDPIAAMDRILNACTRPTLAEADLAALRAERDALRAEVELWKERAYQLSHA